MTTRSLAQRLRALEAGRPLPEGESLPWPRAEDRDVLVLAFVRMGGESSPWGVAFGSPADTPTFVTVPEPRDPAVHQRLVLALHAPLLAHVAHPSTQSEAERASALATPSTLRQSIAGRQLWVPGRSHVDMLHFLDFRYTLAGSVDREPETLRRLREVGRACGWLFREWTRPGQVRVFDATARLREVFTFAAEPVRQSHLGFLLGWLRDGSAAERAAAAAAAEKLSVADTLDPHFEREALLDRVTAHNEVSSAVIKAEQAEKIHAALVPELDRRWQWTVEAFRLLHGDVRPSNPSLQPVVELGTDEWFWQYWRDEALAIDPTRTDEQKRGLGSHPESDFSPARAAKRYFMHLHAAEMARSELVHGDAALVEQAIDAGDAVRGVIVEVRRDGNARGPIVWVVETPADDTLRLREEAKVCVVGARKRAMQLRAIRYERDVRRLEFVLTDGVTRRSVPDQPAADDAALVGTTVTLIDSGAVGISLRKATRVGDVDGPGAWLTHAAPLPEPSPPVRIRQDLVAFVKTLR
jgi:hypothetical protein